MDNQGLNDQNSQDPKQAQPVAEPVSIGNKEQAPVVSSPKVSEYLSPSEALPDIPKEVKEFGVEEVGEKDSFQDTQHLGVQHAGPFTKPLTEPEGKVKLILTEDEVSTVEKKESPSNSIKWLASLIKKAWKKIKGVEQEQ